LHAILKRQGVTFSAATLGAILTAGTVKAAPAGLAATVATSAITGAVAGGGTTLTILKIMAMTKLKAGIAGSIIAAGLVATLVIQQQSQARLRKAEDALQKQTAQMAQLKADNQQPSVLAAAGRNLNTPEELARLRAEAAAMRQQTNDLAVLREQSRQRQRSQPGASTKSPLQQQAEMTAKLNYSKQWMVAFFRFAQKNGDRFPTNYDQAAPFLSVEAKNETNVTTDQFDLLYQGDIAHVKDPARTVMLREKESWQNNGKWARIYAFADGHVEVANSADDNFDGWESQYIVAKPGQ